MTQIAKTFFELLQIALNNKSCFNKFPTNQELMKLYDMACKQSLAGIALEGINKLSSGGDEKPPMSLLYEWIGLQQQTIAQNQLLNKRAGELCKLFEGEGVQSCVLKGQGTALYYDTPELRQCGDIDIWVKKHTESAGVPDILKTVESLGYQYDGVTIQHVNVHFFDDVTVEVHFLPTFMYNYFTNKKIEEFIRKKEATQFKNKDEKAGFTHTTIDFDLVFSIVHIYRHIFSEGIGLRQLMDYYYILRRSAENQREEALKVLESLNMGKFTAGVMWILRECFGMNEEYLLCPVNKKHGEFLLSEIMLSGNFGQYDERVLRIKHNKRFERGLVQLKRNLHFVRYYPSEVLWSPIWKLWHWCWRRQKGYL